MSGVQATPPVRKGRYEYWTRQTPDRPQPCYLRRLVPPPGSPFHPSAAGGAGAAEEVLLDFNEVVRQLGSADGGQVRQAALLH